MGDEQQRTGEFAQRLLERLAAFEVEVVGRLVEDQHVGAGGHQDRQREAPPLATREDLQRLLRLLAAEQEPPEQRSRLARRQPGGVLGRLEHGSRRRRAQLVGVLREEPELDVVAGPELAGHERRPRSAGAPSSNASRPASRSASSCRRRWGRPATRARLAPATAPRPRAAPGRPPSSGHAVSSNTTRPVRSGGLKANWSAAPSTGSRGDPLDPRQLLGP